MKVAELIKKLQDLDEEMTIHIGYDYGDHCHGTVTPEIKEVKEMIVAPSSYYQMDSEVVADEDSLSREGARNVIVLL